LGKEILLNLKNRRAQVRLHNEIQTVIPQESFLALGIVSDSKKILPE
jgi:hypothetical protein